MNALSDWQNPFFSEPTPESLDGGTTNLGPLWHAAPARWGHSMHTMCSYQGMFPARLAHFFIQAYTRPGDLVVDPFSGRGTVPLQARVEGRRTIANDLNPLAFVLTSAKANPPTWDEVERVIEELERAYTPPSDDPQAPTDIRMLYHDETLKQILYLRRYLFTEPLTKWSPTRFMIAGALAGIMHGAQRRDGSSQFLSVSMPNTFSMSPAYVERYIRENGLRPPRQNVFSRLLEKLARLYLDAIEGQTGRAHSVDATRMVDLGAIEPGTVDLLLTSPPYLRVVNYGASNWIRLWLLGIEDVGRDQGVGRRHLDDVLDHRHNYASYLRFIKRFLTCVEAALAPNGVAAIVIGDVAEPGKASVPLAAQIWEDLGATTNLRLLHLIEDDLPVDRKVSKIWGETKGQATDRDCVLVLSRKDATVRDLQTTVDWDEPYKDAGPDAAHARLSELAGRA